jgi:uncharacterized membrane protein HdeD (DUF308 family)
MAASSKRWAVTFSLLRGALLLIGGLVAMFLPDYALKVVVVVGGTVLLVDGVLGALASQNYGIESSWPFWLSIVRGGLAALAGIMLLLSPFLAGALTPEVLSWVIGLGAIAVGLTEAFILIRYRENAPPIWTSIAGAAIYILLGALLIALPMTGALLLMQIGGGLIALFGLIQIVRSWGAAKDRLAQR